MAPTVLLAVAAAGGHPLTPLVVGDEEAGDDEKDFHGVFRIAWIEEAVELKFVVSRPSAKVRGRMGHRAKERRLAYSL
jgi:hypothetical protein